jgi:hypothetical protein
MAWTISDRFPSWGETGEFPGAGFFYEGGDQVNEKHLDALWNGLNGLEGELQAALTDIDSDADGIVDESDTLTAGGNLKGDLLAVGGEVIWDESEGFIPQERLENKSFTVNGGDGLKSGGEVFLGGSTSLDIEPADFAGDGVEDDGADNLRIASTLAGDGLKGGSGSALSIEPADFAGFALADDGSDNLDFQAGDVDADQFSGANGTNDEVLFTDGTNTSWQAPPKSVEASEQDNLGDVTKYDGVPQDQFDARTVVNVSGSGTLVSGIIEGSRSGTDGVYVDVTVDGNTTRINPPDGGDVGHAMVMPPIKFDSSLDVFYEPGGNDGTAIMWVKQ